MYFARSSGQLITSDISSLLHFVRQNWKLVRRWRLQKHVLELDFGKSIFRAQCMRPSVTIAVSRAVTELHETGRFIPPDPRRHDGALHCEAKERRSSTSCVLSGRQLE